MASDLNTRININVAGNFIRRLNDNTRSLQNFSKNGQRELSRLQRTSLGLASGLDKLAGKYTAMMTGVATTYASTRAVMDSAKLDKQLIQIRQTAGATVEMTSSLRKELHEMSQQTGQSFDSLLGGFNNLIQAGMEWDQALLTISAVNPAMAVTGAQAEILTAALSVAGEAFDFDLSKPKLAAEILDQMTVAGRLGNAELEDLSGIFARVGVNSKAANLSFTDTLGFIERLSLIERSPERLSTLADSTLRLFTNQSYLEKASKVSGVSFYDAEGQRRDAFDVLDDIAAKFKNIKSDINKDKALSAMFGGVDLDTLKGLRTLLSGNAISEARAMSKEIANSTGAIGKDLNDALANSVDQVSRLKKVLGEAADDFSKPINEAIKDAIQYLLDEKKLGGTDLLMGGAAAAAIGIGAAKGGSALLKRFGSVGVGVATGKALEEVTGVQPVFVVNMPDGGIGGIGGAGGGKSIGKGYKPAAKLGRIESLRAMSTLKGVGMLGAGAVGTAGLLVGGAGAAGYAAGTGIYKGFLENTSFANSIGEAIAKSLAALGNDNAQAALASSQKYKESQSKLAIEVTDKRIQVKSIESNSMDISVDTGMVTP